MAARLSGSITGIIGSTQLYRELWNHYAAGIYNDLGSGSNVDLCVILKDKVEYLRNFEHLQGKTYQRTKPVIYQAGTAGELSSNNSELDSATVKGGRDKFPHRQPLEFRISFVLSVSQ